MVNDCGMEQVVNFPTRGESILDLFLTNRPALLNRCEALPGIGDHDTVYINTKVVIKNAKPCKRKIYVWKRADIEELRKAEKGSSRTSDIFPPKL